MSAAEALPLTAPCLFALSDMVDRHGDTERVPKFRVSGCGGEQGRWCARPRRNRGDGRARKVTVVWTASEEM